MKWTLLNEQGPFPMRDEAVIPMDPKIMIFLQIHLSTFSRSNSIAKLVAIGSNSYLQRSHNITSIGQ
jgi:hypothetical protein